MSRFRQMLSQRATHIALGLMVLFFVLSIVVPVDTLKRVMDAGRLGFALAVSALCVVPAAYVFRDGAKTRADQVTVAIALVWVVITAQALWIPINREAGLPDWFPREQVSALLPYLYMISAAFFLIPIGNGREDLPTGNWPLIAGAAALGGLAIGLALGLGVSSSVS